MTTVAMIARMLPVALSLGEGGAFRAPHARALELIHSTDVNRRRFAQWAANR
jgi:hypothetical protein